MPALHARPHLFTMVKFLWTRDGAHDEGAYEVTDSFVLELFFTGELLV